MAYFDFAFNYFSDNLDNPDHYHFVIVNEFAALEMQGAYTMSTPETLANSVSFSEGLGGRVLYSVTIGLHSIVLFTF